MVFHAARRAVPATMGKQSWGFVICRGWKSGRFCGALYAFKTVSVVHVASRRGMSKARSRINAPPTREHVQEAPSPTMK